MTDYAIQSLCRLEIPDPVARSVAARLNVRSYDAHRVVWAKGGRPESWQFIISGLVAAATPMLGAASVPIKIYGPDSWFGEQPILNAMPSSAEFFCLAPTQVLVMPKDLFFDLFDTEPGFSRHIAKLTAWRLQEASEMLTLMKLGNPCLRLVIGMGQFAEALAFHSEHPLSNDPHGKVELPVTQAIIASLCGVSRTLASTFLQHLVASGFVSISYGRMELLSIETWIRFSKARRAQLLAHNNPTIDEVLIELSRASCDY